MIASRSDAGSHAVPSAESRGGEVGSETMDSFLREHPLLVTLGRVGWVAKGIVYTLVGVLAASIALHSRLGAAGADGEASKQGAISTIADGPFGSVALLAVAVGLLLYACWRIVTVLLPADNDARTWATRLGYVVSTVVYTVLAWSALTYVLNPGSSNSQGNSEDARVEGFTREIMSHAGGRWVVALVGLALIGLGLHFFAKGVGSHFEDQLTGGSVGPVQHRHLVVLGRIGWAGRGMMMVLIGWFVVRAAQQFEPDRAEGLDGSLRRTVESTTGTVLVMAVAVGLVCYGVYCIVSVPRRRLAPADE